MEQINSSEEPAVNVDQEHQKPQSWLASYQEQVYCKTLIYSCFCIGWSNGTDKQFRRACCEC